MADDKSSTTTHLLAGRMAIVTGASRGIGRAITLHMVSLDASFVLNYSSSSQVDLLVAEINSSSSSSTPCAVAVRANVSEPVDVKSFFDRAESFFGTQAHILVACAGVLDSKCPSLADTTMEDRDSTFAINARSAFLCYREAANHPWRGGSGHIVTVSSSLLGALWPRYAAAYTVSKAAVEAMMRILTEELRGTGITANCMAPGPVVTELFFVGKSEEDMQL